MVPFVPHLAHECLELHKCKTVNMWPSIKKNDLIEKIKLAVQVNGKTRDILEVSKDLKEKDINDIINSQSKAKKYLEQKKIKKVIFVKNKIINYIVI